ncbi:hypothetical protein ACFV30_09165 [Streptomyces sp. NPDC059752]|uniref:hypothetical protein n=1 Tax=unclassified Streptomyces TaxID=2593676 RepID=UPI0036685931
MPRSDFPPISHPYRSVFLGDNRLQLLTEKDVGAFVDWVLTRGRQQGRKPGTGLSLRSVQLTLGRLCSAVNLAVRRVWVPRNLAEHVSRDAVRKAAQAKAKRRPWNEAEVKAFIEAIKGDRSDKLGELLVGAA